MILPDGTDEGCPAILNEMRRKHLKSRLEHWLVPVIIECSPFAKKKQYCIPHREVDLCFLSIIVIQMLVRGSMIKALSI